MKTLVIEGLRVLTERQPNPKLGAYIEKLEKLLRDNKHSKPQKTGKALYEELCPFSKNA